MGRIALHDIRKAYGAVEVLKGIDLTIEEGELAVFVGPSGCGKSTLLRMIAGLDRPSSGRIEIDGRNVTAVGAADRGLAMVFQSYALYPHMTVRQNMAFGMENAKMPRAEINARLDEAARMLEIEPLSNLDAELRVSMRAELSALHGRLGATMIHVTHDQVEAMTMADRIIVLRAGKVEQVETPLNLYNRPANLFVAGFIGAPGMNLWSATAAGAGVVRLSGGPDLHLPDLPLPAAGSVTLGIRPQHLRLAPSDGPLTARVTLIEALGAESVVHAELDGGARLLAVLPGQPDLGKGAPIRLGFDTGNLHVFDAEGQRLPGV
jgi:multiple sugar transport system ATP-binding protein